jgi:hypothetical protein
MADQVMTTSNQVSVLVPEIWSRRFYDTLLADLPFNSIISRDYEGEIQNLGDTVKISTVPEFGDAEEIEEDGRADADSVTITQQNLEINRRVVKDFIVTNKALMQSVPFVEKVQELAIYSVQKKIQQTIINNTIPSASAPVHQISYDSGTTLALADMLEAKELLDAADVPMSDRHFVVGAAQLNDIFNITGFTSSDFLVSGAPLQTGELPSALLGFQPHFTSVVGNTSRFFHASYLTMAPQRGMNVNRYDLGVDGKRAERVNVDMLYGLKQLGNDRVVSIS